MEFLCDLQCRIFENIDGASKIKVAQDRFASYVPEKHKHNMDEKNKEKGIIDAKLSQKWAAKEQTENDIAQMQNRLKKINQDFKQNQQENERRQKSMQFVLPRFNDICFSCKRNCAFDVLSYFIRR